MKRSIIITFFLIMAIAAFQCKKTHTSPSSSAYCTSCTDTLLFHGLDSDSVYYYLPTAFTPNGDGKNDVYGFTAHNLITDSTTITIWDSAGVQVYTGNGNSYWDGLDTHGAKCSPGHYPVHVKLMTITGAKADICTCVTLIRNAPCDKGSAYPYYFTTDFSLYYIAPIVMNDTVCP